MKITQIEAIPFRIPMAKVEHFATGSILALEHVLIRIHTDEGVIGQAEAPPRSMIYGESMASICAAVRDWFAPQLIGRDPCALEQVFALFERVEHNSAAKSAIDIALHDIKGQIAGMPLYKLFGGWSNEVEVSYILGLGTPDEAVAEVERMIERHGFQTFKLKVGLDADADTALLRAVRQAVGPKVRLYVDANHAYPSVVAARTMQRWEELDVAWVEEPSPAWDHAGRAFIARASGIPVMGDESCKTVAAVVSEIQQGYTRMISIKTGGTGFTLSRRILTLCEAFGIVPISGSQSDSDFGMIAGAHFNASHRSLAQGPGELSSFLDVNGHLLKEPPQIKNGRFTLPDRPGLGVEIDEAQLTKYRLDR
jgi:L-Ala-D/L-Glu epimerase